MPSRSEPSVSPQAPQPGNRLLSVAAICGWGKKRRRGRKVEAGVGTPPGSRIPQSVVGVGREVWGFAGSSPGRHQHCAMCGQLPARPPQQPRCGRVLEKHLPPALGAPPPRARAQPAPHVLGTSPRTLCPGMHRSCQQPGPRPEAPPSGLPAPWPVGKGHPLPSRDKTRLAVGASSGSEPLAGLGLTFLYQQPHSLRGLDCALSLTGHSAAQALGWLTLAVLWHLSLTPRETPALDPG